MHKLYIYNQPKKVFIQYLFPKNPQSIIMIKVQLDFQVCDQLVERIQLPGIKKLTKETLGSLILNFTGLTHDLYELSYRDTEDDSIMLENQEDFAFAKVCAQNLDNFIKITLNTNQKINFTLPVEEKSEQITGGLKNSREVSKIIFSDRPLKKNMHSRKKQKQRKRRYAEKELSEAANEETFDEQFMSKEKKKANKNAKKKATKSKSKITATEFFNNSAQLPKQSVKDSQEILELDEISEEKSFSIDQLSLNDHQSSLEEDQDEQSKHAHNERKAYRENRRMYSLLNSLKKNIKQEIMSELPQYVKPQCLIPQHQNYYNQADDNSKCHFCKKSLAVLLLPIYINNKNEFICSDCEQCQGDDALLVKIKTQQMLKTIFMVKCIPVFKKELSHLEKIKYTSQMQKYEEKIKAAKKIVTQKVKDCIFKEQMRSLAINREFNNKARDIKFARSQEKRLAKMEYSISKKKQNPLQDHRYFFQIQRSDAKK